MTDLFYHVGMCVIAGIGVCVVIGGLFLLFIWLVSKGDGGIGG